MEPVNVVGVGMTQFGVLEDSIIELAQKSGLEALNDSSTIESKIDHLVIGTQNPEEFTSGWGL